MANKVNTIDFIRKLDAVTDAYKKLPAEIATTAVNFSKDRFRDQAWLDTTKEPWKKLKRQRRGRNGKVSNNQTILVKSARLKRSIRKISVTESRVIIGTDVPYAQAHNDGVKNKDVTIKEHIVKEHNRTRNGRKERVKEYTVKAHSRKMNIPERKFIGNSYTLERRIVLLTTARFMRALKK
ncbi:phage virion morphogenesis protein [Paludibacteraceae bacterium OttesenSCG-928-F17]|nr:phage virion morphogenesis protein [Paludibacteraceae bacterium OttesenSCG-928-F17]